MTDNLFIRLRGQNIIATSLISLAAIILNFRTSISFDPLIATIIFLSTTFFNIYIWVANDYYDAPWDKEDDYKRKRNVFCDPPTSPIYRIGKIIMWVSLIGGIFCGLLLISESFIYLLLILAGMLLAYLYTSPTFRAKSRIALDWIFHVVWWQITFVPLYLYIYGIDVLWKFDNSSLQFYSLLIIVSLMSLIAQINHQIPDHDIDNITNQITTVVKIGIDRTKQLRYGIYLVLFLATTVICIINNTWLAIIGMIAYSLYYIVKKDIKKAEDSPSVWPVFFLIDYLIITPVVQILSPLFL